MGAENPEAGALTAAGDTTSAHAPTRAEHTPGGMAPHRPFPPLSREADGAGGTLGAILPPPPAQMDWAGGRGKTFRWYSVARRCRTTVTHYLSSTTHSTPRCQ